MTRALVFMGEGGKRATIGFYPSKTLCWFHFKVVVNRNTLKYFSHELNTKYLYVFT